MKKVLFLMIMFVSFVACTNDESETKQASSNAYDYVGKLHNEGMRYIFKGLSTTTRTEVEGDDPEEVLVTGIEEYLSSVLTNDPRFDVSDYYEADVAKEIADAISYSNQHMRTATSLAFSDKPIEVGQMIDSLDICFSAKNDLEEIYQNFESYSNTALSSYLSSKENQVAISNYTDLEKAVLSSALSIGRNSLDYWGETEFTNGLSGKKVAKADLVGAISGVYNNRGKILFAARFGGWIAGAVAAARYAFVQGVIESTKYAYVESDVMVDEDEESPLPDGPIKKH